MDLDQLKQALDEREIGDPGVVDDIDQAVPELRDELDADEEGLSVWLVATASFFRDPVDAYRLLRRSLPVLLQKPGGLKGFYEQQERVWRGRRDKSQHDLEYLQIVLGVKDRAPKTPMDEGEDELIQGIAEALLQKRPEE
jgi:hypothetical protein